ncbi:MAG: hypothetical protein MK135_09770, partial [Polyangiaceae bacterium]|nr:hypothetical protein [Polyangiaceae bacterium]
MWLGKKKRRRNETSASHRLLSRLFFRRGEARTFQPQREVRCSLLSAFGVAALLASCSSPAPDEVAADIGRGPGERFENSTSLNESFRGGVSVDLRAREVSGTPDVQDCDSECESYCQGLIIENPLDEALCSQLWGAGFDTRPLDEVQSCRRLYVDLTGKFPSKKLLEEECLGRPLAEVAEALLLRDSFVFINQRRWADVLKYNNLTVSMERIFDLDQVVGKLYRGEIRYDEFVSLVSAHPVLTRRYDNANDRAEALFSTFVGRAPFDDERGDMAKLYGLWSNGYYDHPVFKLRLPDSYIRFSCITEDGEVDPATAGACTSVLWGYHPLILLPDFRSRDGEIYSGNLTPSEWQLLELPGRIISSWPEVWEHAVTEALHQYLGYEIEAQAPAVVQALVEYALEHQGDIRSIHYAIVTSQAYLQSTECTVEDCGDEDAPRWTYGPLRQVDAEVWIDSLAAALEQEPGACDHRLPETRDLLEDSILGAEILADSRWPLDGLSVDRSYADLAQTLGGCPDNQVAGRYKAISILSTATQEAYASELCNPANVEGAGVDASLLLPEGVAPR